MTGRVAVFAREPVPGRVKTRLAAGIGPTQAAAVYRALLDHTVEVVRASGHPWTLFAAERPTTSWASELAAEVEIQAVGGLGRRMADCFDRSFAAGSGRVVIVGSDTAHLTGGHLDRAFVALDTHPVVLGPAEDGGYWLIGQREPAVDCLSGVPWSHPDTLTATRRRLESLGAGWAEIDTLPDIDTVDDLERALDDPRVDPSLRDRLRGLVP